MLESPQPPAEGSDPDEIPDEAPDGPVDPGTRDLPLGPSETDPAGPEPGDDLPGIPESEPPSSA